MDPLTTSLEAIVILGATRYLLHAVDQVSQAWNTLQKGNRPAALKKAANVLLATLVPCSGTLTWGYSAIPGGGTLGALFTGLAIAAAIAGLHNVGKEGRQGKAVENRLSLVRLAELVVQLRAIGAGAMADAVAEGRTPGPEDVSGARPAQASGRYPGPYNPAYGGGSPGAAEGQVPGPMGEDSE